MRIALVLVCCLASSIFWGATVGGMELQQQSNTPLTEEQKRKLQILQRQVSDEAGDSKLETQPRQMSTSPGRDEYRSGTIVHRAIPKPTPIKASTPTPQPTTPVTAMTTPSPISKPAPPVSNTNSGFVVSLALLVLVGLVTLFIMGKKIYVLARGG